MAKLDGKVAVITGGSTGIGLATAKLFVNEGAHVFITGRRQQELDEAVKAIGKNVTAVQGDVAKSSDLDRLYATVKKEKGRVDIVFANAGIAEPSPLAIATEEHFDKLFNVNVKGVLLTVQKALPSMPDGGSIVFTGSVAGEKGTSPFGVYASTKATIRCFVRTLTVELKDRHIRTNIVSPGPIDTPILGELGSEVLTRLVSSIPMGRIGRDEEVAKAVLFLASDDASYVTGVELFVDGGLAAT